MLYLLAEYLESHFSPPGFNVFKYLTFRSALAAITALLLTFYVGPKVLALLKKMQIGEAKKEDGPKFHWSKAGTPTMGGLIILMSGLIPVLLWGDLRNIYILLVLFTDDVIWFGGFFEGLFESSQKEKKGPS